MYVDVGGGATNFMVGIILVTAVSSGIILLLVVTIFTFIYYYIHKRKSGFTLETNTSYGKLHVRRGSSISGGEEQVGTCLTNILDHQK